MRGLARAPEQYYARLNNADLPRRNDYDGRGPLSQEELVAFARYLLEVCLDQVRFMSSMLELDALRVGLGTCSGISRTARGRLAARNRASRSRRWRRCTTPQSQGPSSAGASSR